MISLRPLEYHVLLALLDGPQYGYAIKSAVVEDSGGAQSPGPGSLYRVLARLLRQGLVVEQDAPEDGPAHPGLSRRYYELSSAGRRAVARESRELQRVAALATERLGPRLDELLEEDGV